MSAPRIPTAVAADPWPDRPAGSSRRAELTAALGVAVVLVHVLFVPVTLVLLGCALIISAVSRWRPLWLTVPAAAGTIAAAAAGPGRVLAGFTAGPRQMAAYLGGLPGHPARLAHLAAAFAGPGQWLPRQLPLALLAAAGEAAILAWLGWPGGGRPADREWPDGAGRYRPGLVITVRRRLARRALAAGEVVTAEGASLGIDVSSGRHAEITWAQAERGVLLAAASGQAAARAGFPLAGAAVRRRKTVIVIDLSGSRWLAAALGAACAEADVPLARFGAGGPGCYEPFRSHPPARAADLAAQLVDWSGGTEQQRQAGQRYLADAFIVLAAAPPPGPVLDGLLRLLEPGALARAAAGLPGHLPARVQLARYLCGPAAPPPVDPETAAVLSGQLHRLRASALGGWLRPAGRPAGAATVALGRAVRDRDCVLFSLGPEPDPAASGMAGRLAVADLAAVLGDLAEQGLRGDCLAWVHGCEAAAPAVLDRLLAAGPATGTAVALSTGSAAAAARLAGTAGVLVSSGPTEPRLAARLAELAPFRQESSRQELADVLSGQDEDHFAVIARLPRLAARLQPECRSVPRARPR
jgi:hypothetical protein